MNSNNPEIPENNFFYKQYTEFNDAQILEILRNHKDYQEIAVHAAVKIAIERQLIHSEQDLMAPEFQNSKVYRFAFFPEISNDYQRERLLGSLFRFLYVISFIPIIYGFLKYGEGYIDQTYLGVSVGVIWFLLCILLKKTQKLYILIPLFVLLALMSVSASLKIFTPETFRILDLVMLIIGMVLTSYLLLFLKKLIQTKPKDL